MTSFKFNILLKYYFGSSVKEESEASWSYPDMVDEEVAVEDKQAVDESHLQHKWTRRRRRSFECGKWCPFLFPNFPPCHLFIILLRYWMD